MRARACVSRGWVAQTEIKRQSSSAMRDVVCGLSERRDPACSVVLTGSRDGSATCSAAEIAGSEYQAAPSLFLTHGLSSQLEQRGVH